MGRAALTFFDEGLPWVGRRLSFCIVHAILAGLIFFSGYSLARASGFQELFPDHDVSRQPFVEFRARGAAGLSHPTGHVFVVLGYESDNGTRVHLAVLGFYPDPENSAAQKLEKLLPGAHGALMYKFTDMHSDVSFHVRVSAEDAYKVLDVITQWEKPNDCSSSKAYSLLIQNCISFVDEVAAALKLQVPAYQIQTLLLRGLLIRA